MNTRRPIPLTVLPFVAMSGCLLNLAYYWATDISVPGLCFMTALSVLLFWASVLMLQRHDLGRKIFFYFSLIMTGLFSVVLFLPGLGRRSPLIILASIVIYGAVAVYLSNRRIRGLFNKK